MSFASQRNKASSGTDHIEQRQARDVLSLTPLSDRLVINNRALDPRIQVDNRSGQSKALLTALQQHPHSIPHQVMQALPCSCGPT